MAVTALSIVLACTNLQHKTNNMLQIMGRPKLTAYKTCSRPVLWGVRYSAAGRAYKNPPMYNIWYCIFGNETGHTYNWHINTGNGYYGGLQMDQSFMQTYAPYLLDSKGTADKWNPLEQIWTAIKAWRERGFSPWPNTAPSCLN